MEDLIPTLGSLMENHVCVIPLIGSPKIGETKQPCLNSSHPWGECDVSVLIKSDRGLCFLPLKARLGVHCMMGKIS